MYHQSYLDGLNSQDYEEFLFWSGQISRKPLDNPAESGIIAHMEELEYDYADDPCERHDDYNVWEEREIMNDREWEDNPEEEWEQPDYDYDRDEAPEYEPQEDFGYFGEMGLWD